MQNSDNKIILITAGGPYPWVIANAISNHYGNLTMLIEEPESKTHFLKRRAKIVGNFSTLGQFLTMLLSKFGKRFAIKRTEQIIAQFNLKIEPNQKIQILNISSPNSDACRDLIKKLDPDVIFLAGCRMLTAKTLSDIPCPILNYHAGINPKYRGMQGGYWARKNQDAGNYGTTVHLVDNGVDTGGILYHQFIEPNPDDTMLTDALYQVAHSVDISLKSIDDVLSGKINVKKTDLPTHQWFHPPIWSYIWTGLTKRIW